MYSEGTKETQLPFWYTLVCLTKYSRCELVKNVACNPMIYREYCKPEGQRFTPSTRNLLSDLIIFAFKHLVDSLLFYNNLTYGIYVTLAKLEL